MPRTKTKFIFVIGGVMSGVGKGVSVASIAKLIQSRGIETSAVKIDPYLNIDAGTMNPVEHGEVFVTEDGDETDQDIGNYERFLGKNILSPNYMTLGRVYKAVLDKERALAYGGKCVEPFQHIPEEVTRRLENAARKTKSRVLVVEVGGTVGEYQNLPFLEAARLLKLKRPGDVLFVLVSYLPVPGTLGEMKTKPTQMAVQLLNSSGIQADFIIGRSTHPLDAPRKQKLATFCGVLPDHIISAPDVSNIYEIPLQFERAGLDRLILKKFGLTPRKRNMSAWRSLIRRVPKFVKGPKIAVVGKYFASGDFTLPDAYISVVEALRHAGWAHGRNVELTWVNSEEFEKNPRAVRRLSKFDGIFVPGGFGGRGVEGKIRAIQFAREHRIPYLGICYGMQLAAIEFARHVLGVRDAHTTEVSPRTKHPVIDLLPSQLEHMTREYFGGTMRLGAYPCKLKKGTKAYAAYKRYRWGDVVEERHRHRYEFNNEYREAFEKAGAIFSGVLPKGNLVEIFELKNHPFFVGTQFHPEFKSRPLQPHPLYAAFIGAALGSRR